MLNDHYRMGVATIITIPSVYYLLQPRSPPDEGGHGHAEHASESHAEKPAEEGKDENADEGSDQGGESPAKKNPKGPDSKGTKVGAGVSSTNADEQGKKEEGISNTDTAHSSDISQDPGKSKKGEGTAETAKIKGTVKPDRPTVSPLLPSSVGLLTDDIQPEQTNKSDDK